MNVAVADPGAVADLTASLAEGAAGYVAEVLKRVPGAQLVVQLDEPSLPAVAEGEVPTASGLSRLAAVEADTLRDGLAQVLASIRGYTVVHCCATTVPFGIIRAAGTDAVSFDLSQLRRGEEDAVAEAAEAGMGLLTGAVSTMPDGVAETGRGDGAAGVSRSRQVRVGGGDRARGQGDEARGRGEARETAERVIRFWRRLGLPLATCAEQAVITPACGLPGTSMAQARAVLTRCREAASMLPELIEETGGDVR